MTTTVLMDLGVADVHTTSAGSSEGEAAEKPRAGVKKRRRAARNAKRKLAKSFHIRADIAAGGGLHVRHLNDQTFYDGEGVDIVALSDDAAAGPVWNQIAKSGAFAGHPAGPFELNVKVFDEIVINFKATKNRAVPIDYEHASEMSATSGSIPTSGAPAQGWIRDLKIEGGNLYALVEWLPRAREQIRSGGYKFISPAIRFESKDRVTGKPVGARLTSAGLTNEPFLDGMLPLAAKDDAHMLSPKDFVEAVETIVDAALEEHESENQGGVERALANKEETIMAIEAEKLLKDIETKAVALKDAETKNAELSLQLKDVDTKRADAETKFTAAEQRATGAEAKVQLLEGEVKLLRDSQAKRDEEDVKNEVEAAFRTYKDARKLSDKDKDHMMVLAKASRDSFRGMFPPVEVEHQHLLREVTPTDKRPTVEELQAGTETLRSRTLRLMKDKKMSFEDAQIEASRKSA